MRPTALSHIASLGVVALGLIFALSRFAGVDEPMRHWDTRWLHAGAICLWDGLSPYNAAFFDQCWAQVTDAPFRSTFVFGMPVFALMAPLGGMDIAAARSAADIANALALAGLVPILWMAAEMRRAEGVHRLVRALWLAFGLSLSGVAGAGYVGQPAIFVAVGMGLLYLGALRNGGPLCLAVGTFLCLIKPHICLLPLFVAWLRRPLGQRTGKVLAIAAVLLSVAVAASLQGALIEDFREALRLHSEGVASKLSSVQQLLGVSGVVARLGPIVGSGLVIAVFLAAAGMSARWLGRTGPDTWDALFVGGLFIGLMLVPVKGYDFSVLTLGYAIAARQSAAMQAVLALPLLVVWRPALLHSFGLSASQTHTIVTLMAILVGAVFLGAALGHALATRRMRAEA